MPDKEKSEPETVMAVYRGPSGRLIDGSVTLDLNQPVKVSRARLERLRATFTGHTFDEVT